MAAESRSPAVFRVQPQRRAGLRPRRLAEGLGEALSLRDGHARPRGDRRQAREGGRGGRPREHAVPAGPPRQAGLEPPGGRDRQADHRLRVHEALWDALDPPPEGRAHRLRRRARRATGSGARRPREAHEGEGERGPRGGLRARRRGVGLRRGDAQRRGARGHHGHARMDPEARARGVHADHALRRGARPEGERRRRGQAAELGPASSRRSRRATRPAPG